MTPQYILINEYGDKFYYKDKQMTTLHREDGPAVKYSDGHKEWYSGGRIWYLNNEALTEAEFLKRTSPEIVLTMDEIAAKLGVDVSKLKIKK